MIIPRQFWTNKILHWFLEMVIKHSNRTFWCLSITVLLQPDIVAIQNAIRNNLGNAITTIQDRGFPCSYCLKPFGAKYKRDAHELIHTGVFPYVCDVEGCEKAFRQKIQLTNHRRTHTGERPYICSTCGKSYLTRSHLNTHIGSKHGELAQIPWWASAYNFCEKSTSTSEVLIYIGGTLCSVPTIQLNYFKF